jgi:hypothetical protein
MYAGDYNPAFESGRLLGYDLPQRGRYAFSDPGTGAISTDVNRGAFGYAPGTSPIEAPYEGMRRLDNSFDYMGETHARVLPWQGRGSGTNWDLFDEFDGFDGGYSVPSLPMGFTPNALMDSFPYRTFASTSLPSFPNRTISSGRRVNYGDIMNARGSLMQNYNEIPFSQFDIPF